MMSAVACATVPKITVVIGGCHGADSFAMVSDCVKSIYLSGSEAFIKLIKDERFHSPMLCLQCGRAFDPNFLFLWPNARVSLTASGHVGSLLPPDDEQEEDLNEKLKEESSAFFSSARMWDDGVILPQDTRKVNWVLVTFIK